MHYPMYMIWSDVDQAYIVTVPDLPGCMADGRTADEAIKNVQIVIEEWISIAKEENRDIPEPSKGLEIVSKG